MGRLSSRILIGATLAAFAFVSLAGRASAEATDDVSKRLAAVDARIAELAKENAALRAERVKLAEENAKLRKRIRYVDDRRQGASLQQETSVEQTSPPVRWAGIYVGGFAGGAWGRDSVTGTESAPVPPFSALDVSAVSAAASPNLNTNGSTGGVQVGWNYQTGHAVFGIENDFGAFHLRGSSSGTFNFPGTPGAVFSPTTSFSTDWLYTARARVGWASDNWLAYVTGGLAVTRENVNQTIVEAAPFVFSAPIISTREGWIVGGGIDYALNANWSAKIEYLYADFGSIGGNGVLTPPFAGFTYANSSRLTTSIARIGVNYRIGGLQ